MLTVVLALLLESVKVEKNMSGPQRPCPEFRFSCSFKQLIHTTECSLVLQSLPSPSLHDLRNYVFLSWHVPSEKSESGF